MEINNNNKNILFIKKESLERFRVWLEKRSIVLLIIILSAVSIAYYVYYYQNGLGLAYNDARSHLDIGRRVVEGLKPGMAQLGSVWLPLTHFLMIITISSDFMWHSGLAGAIQSMIAFVATGIIIYCFLREIGVGLFGRWAGVCLFAANLNILYLQSTAMTELMLLFTMTTGAYLLLLWLKNDNIYYLILSAFWIMLSTLVRYDGWFMLFFATITIIPYLWMKKGWKRTEGTVILFCSLAGYGVLLWLLWNLIIFKDPLYFIFGPFSAHAQQKQLEAADLLATKHNWLFSAKIYLHAMAYNIGAFTMILGFIGAIMLWLDKKVKPAIRAASLVLIAPLLFNILALYLGHSVLYVAGLSGDTWFNARYGIMMMPSIAIFTGWLIHRLARLRMVIAGLLAFTLVFSFTSYDAVTIDDAITGSSQKNVTEVSGWLRDNVSDKPGFIFISVASHDAIIFSSGLPMKRFIHEGTGKYYDDTVKNPDKWARWIIARSYSETDSTWMAIKDNPDFNHYELVDHYPFADIYELKNEYLDDLITQPIYYNTSLFKNENS